MSRLLNKIVGMKDEIDAMEVVVNTNRLLRKQLKAMKRKLKRLIGALRYHPTVIVCNMEEYDIANEIFPPNKPITLSDNFPRASKTSLKALIIKNLGNERVMVADRMVLNLV